MSAFPITLNSELIPSSRREEAEVIVRSYFPAACRLIFNYTGSHSPSPIINFPNGAFGSFVDWSDALACYPDKPEDAGEVVRPHVEAELTAMLVSKERPRDKASDESPPRQFPTWSWKR